MRCLLLGFIQRDQLQLLVYLFLRDLIVNLGTPKFLIVRITAIAARISIFTFAYECYLACFCFLTDYPYGGLKKMGTVYVVSVVVVVLAVCWSDSVCFGTGFGPNSVLVWSSASNSLPVSFFIGPVICWYCRLTLERCS